MCIKTPTSCWPKFQQGNQRWQIPRPAPCQCLATFTPSKWKHFDIFSWRHFSARSSFYIINWYGYPWKTFERNCQSSFWDTPLNCCMLNVAHVTNDAKWRPIVTTFGTLIENMSRTGLSDCHIFQIFFNDFMSTINCGIRVLHVKRQILTYFLWRHFSARSSFYCFIWWGIQRGVCKKILKIVFLIWLYLQKAKCDLDLWPMKVNVFSVNW